MEAAAKKASKRKFTADEDTLLLRLVGDSQFPNWPEIAPN
jgi:hypothetical protein